MYVMYVSDSFPSNGAPDFLPMYVMAGRVGSFREALVGVSDLVTERLVSVFPPSSSSSTSAGESSRAEAAVPPPGRSSWFRVDAVHSMGVVMNGVVCSRPDCYVGSYEFYRGALSSFVGGRGFRPVSWMRPCSDVTAGSTFVVCAYVRHPFGVSYDEVRSSDSAAVAAISGGDAPYGFYDCLGTRYDRVWERPRTAAEEGGELTGLGIGEDDGSG